MFGWHKFTTNELRYLDFCDCQHFIQDLSVKHYTGVIYKSMFLENQMRGTMVQLGNPL